MSPFSYSLFNNILLNIMVKSLQFKILKFKFQNQNLHEKCVFYIDMTHFSVILSKKIIKATIYIYSISLLAAAARPCVAHSSKAPCGTQGPIEYTQQTCISDKLALLYVVENIIHFYVFPPLIEINKKPFISLAYPGI